LFFGGNFARTIKNVAFSHFGSMNWVIAAREPSAILCI